MRRSEAHSGTPAIRYTCPPTTRFRPVKTLLTDPHPALAVLVELTFLTAMMLIGGWLLGV